mmetsp:Transcript_14933/g.51991  ORF Transcript_14933/g.51991 Transcript_14933/m.51991 type:complete len:458 (-) Transcript_14933:71-1444(-)
MLGFGAAFTDSATHVLGQVNKTTYDRVMDMYFGPDGLQYTFGRIPMGACDFTLWPEWSYDDKDNDTSLSNFTIAKDLVQRIPMMKDAIARRAKSNATIKFFGSPWSAPGWMKANGAMICGAKAILTGCALKSEPIYHTAFANYFAKWIEAYNGAGVPIWGVTVMNEPQENLFTYEGQVFTPETERDFVKDFLGPTLAAAAPDVKIMMLDHNKNHLPDWVPVMMGDKGAAKYLWGTAVHWYTGDHFDLLNDAHNNFTSKSILATEATEPLDTKMSTKGGTWAYGEHYAHDIMGDFNNYVRGWVDWNMALDKDGGPLHIGPVVSSMFGSDSMMIMNIKENEAHPQAFYYYVGQISKFMPEGSVRIGYTFTPTAGANSSSIESVNFVTPEGNLVTVMMNRQNGAFPIVVENGGQVTPTITLPPHSIVTLQYPASPKEVAAADAARAAYQAIDAMRTGERE